MTIEKEIEQLEELKSKLSGEDKELLDKMRTLLPILNKENSIKNRIEHISFMDKQREEEDMIIEQGESEVTVITRKGSYKEMQKTSKGKNHD